MKQRFSLFGGLAILLMITSCGPSIKVSTDYDKSVDFSKYKTFALYQMTDKSGAVSDLNKNRIINAVEAEMKKKGLSEVSGSPDLLVNVTTIFEDKKSVTANSNYYGYGGYYRPYGWGPGMGGTTTYNVYEYKDGSMIIDLVDAAQKQLVWQGTGNKEIDKPSKDPDKAIADAVARILSGYPPKKK